MGYICRDERIYKVISAEFRRHVVKVLIYFFRLRKGFGYIEVDDFVVLNADNSVGDRKSVV